MLTIEQSQTLLMTFMLSLIIFNVSLVPLAQAIWSTKMAGYKTLSDTMNSLFMIAYSKGDLEEILDINLTWSFVFILLYYFGGIYFMHAAFHHTQTNALLSTVLRFSISREDILEPEKPPEVGTNFEITKRKQERDYETMQHWIGWFLMFIGQANVNKIMDLMDKNAKQLFVQEDPPEEEKKPEKEEEDTGEDEEAA